MYCNYSKTDKFGEMKFVAPPWINSEVIDDYNNRHLVISKQPGFTQDYWIEDFVYPLETIELTYNNLIKDYNWRQEQAAEILPQCTAADVVMSGFASDFEFVFRLRSDTAETGKPHPLVEELMTPLRDEFINKEYIKCLTKNF